ncbi:MAG: DUF4215 domain-containing protein [Deltaproteobacteria bacterium]|nr:DUF4215 domain-containing protein [Deltaproteobacteria bacterium]
MVPETGVTGVRLVIEYEAQLGLDRAAIDATNDGAPFKSAELSLPAKAGAGLAQESVVILVDPGLAGHRLALHVRGTRAGTPRAEGTTEVVLIDAQLVDATVRLTGANVVCGDGAIAGTEACDDGGTNGGDGCSGACAVEAGWTCSGEPSVCAPIGAGCGDGRLDGGEACDDGNAASGDGCARCTVENGWRCTGEPSVCTPIGPSCGNGRLDGSETCDDGGTTPGDGCDASCATENGWSCTGQPSTCTPIPPTCGNSRVNTGETCDDGGTTPGDGCNAACAIEAGWACTGEPSTCTPTGPTCGDGRIGAPETCDDGGTTPGDGCNAACATEPGWSCTGQPSTCTPNGPTCGDGRIDAGEGCDDGGVAPSDGCSSSCGVEPGWTCSGQPSVCVGCGDGVLAPGELCDQGQIGQETCWSQGHLDGTLLCNSTCDAYDHAQCGPPIDSAARIQQAINQAYRARGGPEVVSIQPGTFPAASEILLDECANGCQGGPSGIVLRPLSGQVVLVGRGIRVRSGNNRLEGFTIAGARQAIFLEASRATSGGNTVVGMAIENENLPPEVAILVESDDNQILANRIASFSGQTGQAGLQIDGATATTFAMNVIFGRFAAAISIASVGGGAPTLIDQNSVAILAGTGIEADRVSDLCVRSNIIGGAGSTIGLQLQGVTLSNACPTTASGNNAVIGSLLQCSGFSCQALCDNGGALCDRTGDPGWSQAPSGDVAGLCLRPAGATAYVDAGIDLGYDLVDGAPETFTGIGPDMGARETGTARRYGGVLSSCP